MRTGPGIKLAVLVAASLVAGACESRGVGEQPSTTTLTFANALVEHPELEPFANEVARLSKGSLEITFEDQDDADINAEAALIDDVVAGRFDMGWVAQRPWPALGVRSFDALVAPLLIDSYELQAAVLADPLADEMLAGLEGRGIVGLGIVPGPLRYLAAKDRPFITPDALEGVTVGVDDTVIAHEMVKALGATHRQL